MITIPRRVGQESAASELCAVALRVVAVLAFAVLVVFIARLTMGPSLH